MRVRRAGNPAIVFFLGLAILVEGSVATPTVQDRHWLDSPQRAADLVDDDGDYFGNPWGMVAIPGGFIVNDGGVTLRAFNSDGTIRWKFGQRGGGPGEFIAVRDVTVTDDGKVLALDSDAVRITILDAVTGDMVATVPVGREVTSGLDRILPVESPNLAIVQHGATERGNWSLLDATGAVVKTYTLPPPCEALVCSALTAVTEDGSGVVSYRWSSDLVFLNPDGSVREIQDGIEPARMPKPVTYNVDPADLGMEGVAKGPIVVTKVDPTATEVTRSMTVGGSRVFILALGSTENRGRIVDVYTIANGYEGSFLLPSAASDIAVIDNNILVTLSTQLFPVVTLWNIRE